MLFTFLFVFSLSIFKNLYRFAFRLPAPSLWGRAGGEAALNLRERQAAQGISYNHYKEINGEAERKFHDAVGKMGKAVSGDPHPEVSVVGYAVLETTEDEEHDRHDDRKRIAGLSPAIDREIHHCSTSP